MLSCFSVPSLRGDHGLRPLGATLRPVTLVCMCSHRAERPRLLESIAAGQTTCRKSHGRALECYRALGVYSRAPTRPFLL